MAARARASLGIAVADGHLAAVVGASPPPHAVVTSDVDDMRRIASHLRLDVTPVRV